MLTESELLFLIRSETIRIVDALSEQNRLLERPSEPVDNELLNLLVQAVAGLKPGASAQEIAAAIKAEISPASPADNSEVVAALKELSKQLDDQVKAMRGAASRTIGGPTSLSHNGGPISRNNPLPVDIGSASVSVAPCEYTVERGEISVVPGNSQTVVSFVATRDIKVVGISVSGSGDGLFVLDADATPFVSSRINAAAPSQSIFFPDGGRPSLSGSTVTLTVTASGLATASYEGSVVYV